MVSPNTNSPVSLKNTIEVSPRSEGSKLADVEDDTSKVPVYAVPDESVIVKDEYVMRLSES